MVDGSFSSVGKGFPALDQQRFSMRRTGSYRYFSANPSSMKKNNMSYWKSVFGKYDEAKRAFTISLEGSFQQGKTGEIHITHPSAVVCFFFTGKTGKYNIVPKDWKNAADKVFIYGIPLFGQNRLVRDALHNTVKLITAETCFLPSGVMM